MRLGVWQRAAIVASGLWMVGSTLWEMQGEIRAVEMAVRLDRDLCLQVNDPTRDCFADGERSRNLLLQSAWTNAAIRSGFALLSFWMLAGVGYALFRWIAAGKNKST